MRIVIAEDQVMFREILRKACIEFGHEVVGEAGDGQAALRAVFSAAPDLLLLDLNLPELDGFGVMDALRKSASKIRVIALTSARGDYTLFRIEKVGFQGFVDKTTNSLEGLRAAIDAVGSGRVYFCEEFRRNASARKRNPVSFDKVLSERERAVLGLIGSSQSDDEIGARLGISAKTAETYRQRIMDKLDVHGTPKLIRFAIANGFTDVSAAQNGGGPSFP